MDWKALFLTVDGRLGRRDFWIAWAILLGVGLIAGVIPVIGRLIMLAMIVPNVCLASKRLHDFGRSGWLAAIPFAIGVVVGIVGAIAGGAVAVAGLAGAGAGVTTIAGSIGLMILLSLVMLAVGVGFLLWVGLTPGNVGSNAFGAPPTPVFRGTNLV